MSLSADSFTAKYINLEIAPDGRKKLIGLSLMDASSFGQVKRNDWSWASRWGSHTAGNPACVCHPAGFYHSSESTSDFMAFISHTYASTNALLSGNRWELGHLKAADTHRYTLSHFHSKGGDVNRPEKSPLMTPIEVLNRKSLMD